VLAVSRRMNAIRPPNTPLALDPMEVPTTDDGSSDGAEGKTGLRMTAADEFLAVAAKEYQEGKVDRDLWTRALAQSGADESLTIAAYLRARATALRLQRRDRREKRQASTARSTQGTRNRKVDAEPHSEDTSAPAPGVRLGGAQPKLKYAAVSALALASVVAVVWLMAPSRKTESAGQPSASVAAPSADRTSPARPAESAQPVAGSTRSGANQDDGRPSLEAMVRQLKDAGNWNVLVLYASEWTRKQPDNAAAWSELSIGFANLHQFNDALGAAERAVELAPRDALLWRNLGHLNLTLERLPEAGSAFDRVLALNADDADALCGAALVADRLGRTKDADAIARRAKAAGSGCRGLSEGESVAVMAPQPAARKPASSVGR